MKPQQGICPKCNQSIKDYKALEIEDDSVYYPYECKCGFKGNEYYDLNFNSHWDRNGNEITKDNDLSDLLDGNTKINQS